MQQIVEWLQELGLGQYAHRFAENDITFAILPDLTDQDLEKIGVTSLGHRRKLLRAIVDLNRVEDEAAKPISAPAAPVVRHNTAERRQVTLMFSDLVGSTALSTRMDPEDLRNIISAYQQCVAETVQRFGGFVAKYMGDGVLVYFGYPQAHEDDAERAVRAGLALIQAVRGLNFSAPLQTRVGVATGLVVVGDLIGSGAAQEQAVVGETPNLAARLQAVAEPDSVVIASSTRRLVGDLFEVRDLGAIEFKGLAAPMLACQVLRPSAIASRFEALRGSALTPLIGRSEEIDLLSCLWARAKAGEGQVMLVSGEPGIGKSRITAELESRLHASPHISLRYFCSPYYQDSALYPFIDQLGRAAGFASDELPADRLEKLEALLARAALPDEDVALLADLLSLPASERHPRPNLSPQRKKERTLEALIRQLEGVARQRPVVAVFEDAHWIDPTSRELLDLVVECVRGLPVLLIVTFRPEFLPGWIGQPQVTMLTLNRLDQHDRTALVAQIAGDKSLPDKIVDEIVDRTDGVPLFIEELTKSVLESGMPLVGIPTTLHDSLMARLDRLASVRRVAQIGAAIGRQFPYALLRAVSHLPEDELGAALDRLVASELVLQRGTPPDALYSFKHALVQDAAHGSLLRSTRQQLHAQIAEALEAHSPELMDSQPELFAQHYAEAGLVEKSVAYWGKAGRRSAARSAMAEAATQLQKGLDQLALLLDTAERQRQELELRTALGAVLQAVRGHAAPETGQAYARARELWEKLGSPLEFLHIPYGQSRYHLYRGEFDLALRLDEDLLRLGRERNDSSALVLGHVSFGRDLMYAGRFGLSRSHLEEVLRLYDPTSHLPLSHRIGTNPHVNAQVFLAVVLFCLGFPDQALARGNAAIAEARDTAHQPALAASLSIGIRLASLAGADAVLSEWLDELAAVTTEQDFPHWSGQGIIFRGWVKIKNGDLAEGISLLRNGVTAYHAAGSEMFMPHHTALLARACEIAGQIDEAASLLDDALQTIERTGERWFAAELNRLKGQLMLRPGQSEATQEFYCKALNISQEQQAKLWELRAAMSMARLRRDQGKWDEARDLLAPVYGWFTEGFDTLDLKEAKALLDDLAS